jgi:aquaporin Z
MNKYVVEFIGTFFLVLIIGCTVLAGGGGIIPPLAVGLGLAAIIYASGHISGAHFNPAVTIGAFIRGRCPAKDIVPYIAAQLAGAALAAFAVKFLRSGAAPTPIAPAVGPALLAEFLFTFMLVYVILNVATAKGTAGNSFYGLAIGAVVLAGALSVGDISGCALNPAVAVAFSILNLAAWSNIWIYLVANFAGGIAAALAFKALNPQDA